MMRFTVWVIAGASLALVPACERPPATRPPNTPAVAPASAPSTRPVGAAFSTQFKGVDLYAWTDQGEFWFTLLPGTNRNKSAGEIFAAERDEISDSGWFAVTFRGVDALPGQLARFELGESLVVFGVRRAGNDDFESWKIPEAVAESIRSAARTVNLNAQLMQDLR